VVDQSGLTIVRTNSGTEQAGEYAGVLAASGLSAQNYGFAYEAGDFTIVGAGGLRIALEPVTVVYGDSPSYTVVSAAYVDSSGSAIVDLTEQTTVEGRTVRVDDGASGQVEVDLLVSGAQYSGSSRLQSGSYDVKAGVVRENTPNVDGASVTVSGSLVVDRRSVTGAVTAGLTKEYDGLRAMEGVAVSLTPAVYTGDAVTVTAGAGVYADKNAGSGKAYEVTGTVLGGSDAGNYVLTGAIGGSDGEVTPRSLQLVITPQAKVYDGTTDVVTTVSDDRVGGDALTAQYDAAFAGADADTDVPVIVSGLSLTGADAGNYTASDSSGTADITPRIVIIRPKNETKVYGDDDPQFTFTTLPGLQPGDQLSGSLSREPGESVGTYRITLGDLQNSNYTTILDYGRLDILTRELTIGGTFTALDKVYDGTRNAEFDENNLILSNVAPIDEIPDDIALANLSIAFADSASSVGKDVLITNAEITGAAVSNYTLNLDTLPSATATIRPQTPVLINPEDQSAINLVLSESVRFDGIASGSERVELTVTDPLSNSITDTVDVVITVPGEPGSGEEITETFETALDLRSLADGALTVTAVGVQGEINRSDSTSITLNKITTLPEITVDDLITDDITPILTGTSDQTGRTVTVRVTGEGEDRTYTAIVGDIDDGGTDGGTGGGIGTDSTERWEIAIPDDEPLLDGNYVVTATVSDPFDNVAEAEGSLTIDTILPTVQVNDLYTSNRTPLITGTSNEIGNTVQITLSGIENGPDPGFSLTLLATVTDEETWSAQVPSTGPLEDALYRLEATVIDTLNRQATDTGRLTIDNLAPVVAINDEATFDTTPTLTGTSDELGGTLELRVDIGTETLEYVTLIAADSTWSFTIPEEDKLLDGTYSTAVAVTDSAGNIGNDTGSLIINTLLPSMFVDDLITTDPTPVITGQSNQDGRTLTLQIQNGGTSLSYDVVVAADSTWSFQIPAADALDDGTYSVTGTVEDNIGNVATDTGTLILDTQTPLVSVNNLFTTSFTPAITGTSDELGGTVSLTIQNAASQRQYTATVSDQGDWFVQIPEEEPLDIAIYNTIATVTDIAGNTGTDTGTLQVKPDDIWQLTFTSQPNPFTEVDFDLGTIQLSVVNQFGLVDNTFNGEVSIAITEGTGGPSTEDAELIGTTTLPATEGTVTFSGLVMYRSGVDYTITATATSGDTTILPGESEFFSVTPGPPLTLFIDELEEEDADTLLTLLNDSFIEMTGALAPEWLSSNVQGGDIDLANEPEGNRVPMYMLLFDQFQNITFVEENDMPVLISTSSETGTFFKEQFAVDPVAELNIQRSSVITYFFYEDPIPGDVIVEGDPEPPVGANDIIPGSADVVISLPDGLRSTPEAFTTELLVLAPVRVRLLDQFGDPVSAPNPGVAFTASSTSPTGEFFLDPEGLQPVTESLINPAESSRRLYYRDQSVGVDTLIFNAATLNNAIARSVVTISEGRARGTNSNADVPDGIVDVTTELTVRLFNVLGEPIPDALNQFTVNVVDGPNTGAEFTYTDNGDGTYKVTYVPTAPGLDLIEILVNGEPMAGSEFESNVIELVDQYLLAAGGSNQTAPVLSELEQPFRLRAFDETNEPMPNVDITFSLIESPDGAEQTVIANEQVQTDADGFAETKFTLGSLTGRYRVSASADGFNTLRYSATATNCEPAFDGTDSCGPFRYEVALSDTLIRTNRTVTATAQLVDAFGNDILADGIIVSWSTSTTDGFFPTPNPTSVTNQNGQAVITYNSGLVVGRQHIITATDPFASQGSSPVLTTDGGSPASIAINGPDRTEVGIITGPFTIILQDELRSDILATEDILFNLAVLEGQNVAIFASADSASQFPNNQILMPEGESEVQFFLSQTRSDIRDLQATGTYTKTNLTRKKPILFAADEDNPAIGVLAGQSQQAGVLEQLAERLTVKVRDQYDNPLINRSVTFSLRAIPPGAFGMQMFLEEDAAGGLQGSASPASGGSTSGGSMNEGSTSSNSASGVTTSNAALANDIIPNVTTTTDSLGNASVIFITGSVPGEYFIDATSPGLELLEFVVTALENRYVLYQNYPNPFRQTTTIPYEIPVRSDVELTLYSITGGKVATLVNETVDKGLYRFELNPGAYGLASGVYFYQLSAYGLETDSQYIKTRKMVLVK
jgi:hypothetical protein